MLDGISAVSFPQLDRAAGQKGQDLRCSSQLFKNQALYHVPSGCERQRILHPSQSGDSKGWRRRCVLGHFDSWPRKLKSSLHMWSGPWRMCSFRDLAIHDWEPCSLKICPGRFFRCWAQSIYILPSFFWHYLSEDELRYNIEPFFWSSSLNWIPSRFQADSKEKFGDSESNIRCWMIGSFFFKVLALAITISLTFLHSMSNDDAVQLNQSTDNASTLLGSQSIDTHTPLALYSSSVSLYLCVSFWHDSRSTSPGLGSSIYAPHSKYQ